MILEHSFGNWLETVHRHLVDPPLTSVPAQSVMNVGFAFVRLLLNIIAELEKFAFGKNVRSKQVCGFSGGLVELSILVSPFLHLSFACRCRCVLCVNLVLQTAQT